MSWEDHGPRGLTNLHEGMSVAITPGNKVQITVFADVAEKIGIFPGERVKLLIGRGNDERKVRLVKDARGYAFVALGRGSRSVRIFARFWPGGPCVKSRATAADYSLGADYIEFEIPLSMYPRVELRQSAAA